MDNHRAGAAPHCSEDDTSGPLGPVLAARDAADCSTSSIGCAACTLVTRQPTASSLRTKSEAPSTDTSRANSGTPSSPAATELDAVTATYAPDITVPPGRPRLQYATSSGHVKTNYKCMTEDGWRLHLVRTHQQDISTLRSHPVILCPGLGSSGAYSFDLSPAVSLADYLASRGWDVWTIELRGNGRSDKPSLFKRGRMWTVDDYITRDIPAVVRFILRATHRHQLHFLGHSMGGMVLCGVLARLDSTMRKIKSCILIGSGCFLKGSYWEAFEPIIPVAHAMYTVPAGATLRLYSHLVLGPASIRFIDLMYFWPTNTDRGLARAILARNFSNISVGVILQMRTAFSEQGLLWAASKAPVADPDRLHNVKQPLLCIVGDNDNMCPAAGARKTWEMFGSPEKEFVECGPATGFSDHYGHFDILMGNRVEQEVFPKLHDFLQRHDGVTARL